MAVAFTHNGILYIALDEENVERIQKNDPFELFDTHTLHGPFRIPPQVVICYASHAELTVITELAGDPAALVAYLNRGHTITDSDRARMSPPQELVPTKRKGPKH